MGSELLLPHRKQLLIIRLFLIYALTYTLPTFATDVLNSTNICVELPFTQLKYIISTHNPTIDILNNKIKKYHSIDKTNQKHLKNRIKVLKEIILEIKQIKNVDNLYLQNVLNKLMVISKNKLDLLYYIYNSQDSYYNQLLKDIYDISGISDKYTPLILYDAIHYNFSTLELLGKYLYEALDPCHRRLGGYYDSWSHKCIKCNFHDFLFWLEGQNIPVFTPSITIISTQDLWKYKVNIKNGKFYNYQNELINTKIAEEPEVLSKGPSFTKEHIFIIDSKNDLYMCYSSIEIGHPSLSHYKPIVASGKMIIKKGKIQMISLYSGHYRPNINHGKQLIKLLEEKGMKMNDTIKIHFFDGKQFTTENLKKFKEKFL